MYMCKHGSLFFFSFFAVCRKTSDLVFVLDASGSIGSYNFNLMRQWFSAVVDQCVLRH